MHITPLNVLPVSHNALEAQVLERRDQDPSDTTKALIIFAATFALVLSLALTFFFILRYFRARNAEPKYIPGTWLKQKWRAWIPSSQKRMYSSSLQDRRSLMSLQMARATTPSSAQLSARASRILELGGSARDLPSRSSQVDENRVDRRTSGRSIATLPAYTQAPGPTEQLVGREGERGGIDNVIVPPPSAADLETIRDEEMESIYRIRVARRDERADRRALRRAIAAGDNALASELRARMAARNDNSDSAALVQQHQSRDRGRRASSVDYLGLGVARHDGSRVRADSRGSDRGLLEAAAPPGRERSGSGTRLRNASASSGRLMTPDYSDDERSSEFEFVRTPGESRSASRSRLGLNSSSVADVRNETAASVDEPPRYEEAPHTSTRAQDVRVLATHPNSTASGDHELPTITPLPEIEITPFSPAS